MNISVGSRGSEITTFAQHAFHRFIDTETILLHVEEHSGNEYKTDQPIDVDVVEVSNYDEKQFVDDPRKGARTLENNWIYSGSSILLKNEIYQDENEIGSSGIDEGAIAEEKVNILVDSQGSEITREEEFYEETVEIVFY